MKIKINNYSFNKTAKTVTFLDYTTIRLDSILLITNVTTNVIIYNFANAALGGTVLNNVLTLDYNTSAMSDTDKLQIFYEDDEKPSSQALQTTLAELVETLNELAARLNVLAGMANSGQPALRTIPVGNTAVTGTVTAVTTVGTITNFGTAIPAKEMADDINNFTATIANINNVTGK